MDFIVNIDTFDGPLDLMLHLIKESELDIFNLDISVLADQYIDYIHKMEQLHLDVASEYLAQLAALIELKSKKLLPVTKDSNLDEDNYQEANEEDLVRRLIEYQKYKEVTAQFEEMYKTRALLHDKPQSTVNIDEDVEETYQSTSPYLLIKAMKRVLNRYTLANPYEVSIKTQRLTVEDRVKQLVKKVRKYDKVFTLTNLMDDCSDVYEAVVTFLSVLNMVNDNMLTFSIKEDEIYFNKGANYE